MMRSVHALGAFDEETSTIQYETKAQGISLFLSYTQIHTEKHIQPIVLNPAVSKKLVCMRMCCKFSPSVCLRGARRCRIVFLLSTVAYVVLYSFLSVVYACIGLHTVGL